MKKIFLIITLIILSINLRAQNSPLDKNYLKQPGLDKFVGKWTYLDDSVSFSINLRIDKVNLNKQGNAWFVDLIQGNYSLTKDGREVTLQTYKDTSVTSGGFVDRKVSLNKIKFIFFCFQIFFTKKRKKIYEKKICLKKESF